MINLKTLSLYLFRLYCGYFIGIIIIIVGALILSNIFDTLQKFKAIYLPSHLFWKLVLYKIPYLINEVASLISYIAMLFFFKRLTKYNELMTILSGGIHIWRIIVIPVFATIFLGGILITICGPIGIVGLQKYESLVSKLTKNRQNNLVISKSGLLFFENYQDDKRIIQAESIDLIHNQLNNINILFLNNDNSFLKRIDASHASLINGNFKFTSARIFDQQNYQQVENIDISTNLSINNLLNSFINPEMISIWDLPDVIKQLIAAGLPTSNYQVYYYKQLFKPIIMATTIILAACFFSLKQRDNSQEKLLIIGLFLGFISYCLLEILVKTLNYNGSPAFLAVLLPNICMLFLCNFVIMHYKDS